MTVSISKEAIFSFSIDASLNITLLRKTHTDKGFYQFFEIEGSDQLLVSFEEGGNDKVSLIKAGSDSAMVGRDNTLPTPSGVFNATPNPCNRLAFLHEYALFCG